MRILLVDSDQSAATTLSQTLRNASFTVDHTPSGEEAIEMLRHYDYDVVVLELMLNDLEGYEVIRRVRAARITTPILVLSALLRSQAKIRAFSMGADDYMTKPYDAGELVARLQAVMRRSRGFAEPKLRVGNLELDLNGKNVTVDGAPLHLTGKEYAILELLVIRKGSVLTKDAFLNHLYGGIDEPEMKIIDVFICKLRRKLQNVGAGNLIATVWGRGYILREEDVAETVALASLHPKTSTHVLEAAV
ncbi:response regulator transcription factor [Gluconobacter kondonii]|uniref:DNA-binding response regulator n=1 Tax=Gluconobacter kondonii TaxID=941463 RepID=A0ABQ5WPB7_9PROT|nr:response regulator transcription factor [Gluconobacter kondonii]MBS1052297.1 response regulator transcription factor [Gluconobacter kondonii]MBS1055551.1 response regulator transcription factor [Gluconobacter kondonii]MBS1064684.1 response regulator transcription factor [Gluconobacter kondonii]MBS1076298.1 response regulator transcription factor [Gluconobacter kondonii]MBS1080102.1 response regulator transcription factor [Gluconobacter kondonii]